MKRYAERLNSPRTGRTIKQIISSWYNNDYYRSTILGGGDVQQIKHEWIFQEFNFVQSLPPLMSTGHGEHYPMKKSGLFSSSTTKSDSNGIRMNIDDGINVGDCCDNDLNNVQNQQSLE